MQLQCPMPKLDFDMITLGHGSGGLLTNKLLDTGVFRLLENEFLQDRHDGAILPGRMAFTTDSFVVSPIIFPGGDIGDLAINGTVNDVAMCGGRPEYLSLGFILEEGLQMETFWDIMVSIKAAAERAGVQIVTGDTKVVERGKADQIFINTTGIGPLHPQAEISAKRIQPGDKVIVSGNLAAHGVAILSIRQGLQFETDIVSDTQPVHRAVWELLEKHGRDIHLFRDPTRGGVGTTLNEIARDAQVGIELQEQTLPVAEQVAGACELLGLDPLYVANEGLFLAIVDGKVAESCLEVLHQTEEGKHAAIIGEVVAEHPRQVLMHSRIGGRRVINMMAGEQLPRIC
jgi:hydrogenase expression/formation protein HypE